MQVCSALRTAIQNLNFTPKWYFREMSFSDIKKFSDDIDFIKGNEGTEGFIQIKIGI